MRDTPCSFPERQSLARWPILLQAKHCLGSLVLGAISLNMAGLVAPETKESIWLVGGAFVSRR